MIRFLTETRVFRQTIGQLMAETKHKTLPEFLRWRAGIVTKDLIRLTPPRAAGVGTFRDQKKAGENAVSRDVKKLFTPLKEVHIIKNPSSKDLEKQFKRLLASQDYAGLEKLLYKLGIKYSGIVGNASEDLHNRARTGPKRHVAKHKRYGVVEKESIADLLKRKLAHVGKLKAGWMTAATRLGVKGIPQWISRHNVPGQCIDQSRRLVDPFVYIQNDSPAAKDQNPNEIVAVAVRMNEHKMRKELEAILKWKWKEAERKGQAVNWTVG